MNNHAGQSVPCEMRTKNSKKACRKLVESSPSTQYIACMPVKSRPHGSNLTLAGHPASPSGTEPSRGPRPAGRLGGARQSGTERPVPTGGARRCRRGLKHGYHGQRHKEDGTLTFTLIPTGDSSSSHSQPGRDLLLTWAAVYENACVLIIHGSLGSSRCLVTNASLCPLFLFRV